MEKLIQGVQKIIVIIWGDGMQIIPGEGAKDKINY